MKISNSSKLFLPHIMERLFVYKPMWSRYEAVPSFLKSIKARKIDGLSLTQAKSLAWQERNSEIERKCLAIIWAANTFRPYLNMYRFEFFRNNLALIRLHRSKLITWSLQLTNLDFSTTQILGCATKSQKYSLVTLFRAPLYTKISWRTVWKESY